MFHVKHIPVKDGDVSRETLDLHREFIGKHSDRLHAYTRLLMQWNQNINLVSRGLTESEIYNHVIHSTWIGLTDRFLEADIIVDAGTGGGLPGIPLACLYPEKKVYLVDLVEKKCLALRDMVRKLDLGKVRVVHADIARFPADAPFHYVSKHAFKLADFEKKTRSQPWVSATFLKGSDFREELFSVSANWNVTAYSLLHLLHEPFYRDKFLLEINRENRT